MIGNNKSFNPTQKSVLKLVIMACFCTLSGCAWMGETPPDTHIYPASKIEISHELDLPEGKWPTENWWESYGDNQLNSLMNRALHDAPSLAVANARIESGLANIDMIRATLGLSVGLYAKVARERISGEGFLQSYTHNSSLIGATGPWYTQGTIGLKGSYDIDLWGRKRAQLEAAIGRQQAHEAEAAEVKRALSARITTSYFELQSTLAQLDLLTEALSIRNESFQAHSARYKQGLEPQLNIEKSKAQIAAITQQISSAHTKVRVLTEILRALTGSSASDFQSIKPIQFPTVAMGVPRSLGFELLSRRPDLQALRFYVEASIGQVTAAKAAFYPSLNLEAFFGYDAIHLDDLTKASSRELSVTPGLYLPIFDSGRLNAELSIVKTAKNVLVTQYNQAIIDAVRQVAQSSVELENASQQITLQRERVRAAEIGSADAEAYTATGLSDGISALEARLPLLEEKSRFLELCLSQMRAQITLTEALGGGYESKINRID